MRKQFDVFFSYSHSDAVSVEYLAIELTKKNISVWLDKWKLVSGTPFRKALSYGLLSAKSCAVFFGKHTPKGWREEEINKAVDLQTRDKNFRVIPVLLPDAKKKLIDGFLESRTWVEFKYELDGPEALHLLISGIQGNSPGSFMSQNKPKDKSRMDDEATIDKELDFLSEVEKQRLRNEAKRFVDKLKSKRVLFASLNNEIWSYVFRSLKEINELLTNLSSEMSYRTPNDLIQTIDYLIKSISLYLSEYESSYISFMQTPDLQHLPPAHRERNWHILSDAAKDLIQLREVIYYAISNINEFAYHGNIVDWEEPNFHTAYYWIRYAEGRNLCPTCGFNLYYSPTGNCPNCFDGTTFKLEQLYGKSDVFFVGSFNKWKTDAWKMEQSDYGTFIFQIKLEPGKYLYKFLVDKEWILDPNNPVKELDEKGNLNSVLIVN
jgi:hypothetical protein